MRLMAASMHYTDLSHYRKLIVVKEYIKNKGECPYCNGRKFRAVGFWWKHIRNQHKGTEIYNTIKENLTRGDLSSN